MTRPGAGLSVLLGENLRQRDVVGQQHPETEAGGERGGLLTVRTRHHQAGAGVKVADRFDRPVQLLGVGDGDGGDDGETEH